MNVHLRVSHACVPLRPQQARDAATAAAPKDCSNSSAAASPRLLVQTLTAGQVENGERLGQGLVEKDEGQVIGGSDLPIPLLHVAARDGGRAEQLAEEHWPGTWVAGCLSQRRERSTERGGSPQATDDALWVLHNLLHPPQRVFFLQIWAGRGGGVGGPGWVAVLQRRRQTIGHLQPCARHQGCEFGSPPAAPHR